MKINGYNQLRLRDIDWSYPDIRKKDSEWKGKVVEKAGFAKSADSAREMFIILFTDKTFVCIGPKENSDEDEYSDIHMDDRMIYDPKIYSDNLALYHTFVNDKGEIQFDGWIEMLIDMGLWHLSQEEAKEIKEKKNREAEEREYADYLRLKKKFENIPGPNLI